MEGWGGYINSKTEVIVSKERSREGPNNESRMEVEGGRKRGMMWRKARGVTLCGEGDAGQEVIVVFKGEQRWTGGQRRTGGEGRRRDGRPQ